MRIEGRKGKREETKIREKEVGGMNFWDEEMGEDGIKRGRRDLVNRGQGERREKGNRGFWVQKRGRRWERDRG